MGARVIGVTVDHGLQEGSTGHTTSVVGQMAALGVDETASIRVTVDARSVGHRGRRSRGQVRRPRPARRALPVPAGAPRPHARRPGGDRAARSGARLGWAVAAGDEGLLPRSGRRGGVRPPAPRRHPSADRGGLPGRGHHLVGGPPQRRPPLHPVTGADTACCRCSSASSGRGSRRPWPGPASSCATTWTSSSRSSCQAYARARTDDGIDLDEIDDVGAAIRSRCIRRAAIDQGAIASELTHAHVRAVAGLLGVKGKEIQLPGHVTAYAEGEVLHFRRTTQTG